MKWACNPQMFYPFSDQSKDIDVSFTDAPYGKRIEYVRHLLQSGIEVQVSGPNRNRFSDIHDHWAGFLTHADMLKVISQSRINLNFLWTSREPDRSTIKGRTFELAAYRALQLSNDTTEFTNYGFEDGVNIAVFQNKEDMLAKIKYYLAHDKEREAVAVRAYDPVLKKHTWTQRFQAVFERLKTIPKSPPVIQRKYRIIVFVRDGVRHQIRLDDDRLDIQIVSAAGSSGVEFDDIDGVIRLTRNSSINNDALYMMAFGLMVDKSHLIAANFYVESKGNRYWIRFRDKQIEQKRTLLHMLPVECLMFSGKFAAGTVVC